MSSVSLLDVRPVFLADGFNMDPQGWSNQFGLACKDKSRAIQSEAKDADINVIMERFGVTGQLPVIQRPPLVGEFLEVQDYRSAVDLIMEADRAFMQLDAKVRKEFKDDPHAYVEFCSDPANLERMRELGIANPAPVVNNPPAENPA